MDSPGAPKVPELANSFGRDNDVARFDVQMDDTFVVNVVKGLAQFEESSEMKERTYFI